MWDNPRLLNMTAGALTGVAALLFLFAALQLLLSTPLFPLRELAIRGTFENMSRAELHNAGLERIGGNFFSVRLRDVRSAFEGLPWVRRADVRRVWPDRLEVTLEEHRPLARWGEDAMVNTFGERFTARSDAMLPLLAGPAGTERVVTDRYRQFSQLVAPLGAQIRQLVLTPRYAWQLQLSSGLEIVLGRDAQRDAVEARLARFVESYPQTLAKIKRSHEHVDLRYPNGFALRVPGIDREARKGEAKS